MSLRNTAPLSGLRAAFFMALTLLPFAQICAGEVEDAFSAEEIASTYALSEVDEKPRPLNIVEPVREGSLEKERGVVHVAMVIDENGRVTDCRIVSSSNNALNSAALSAVFKWTFEPAKKDGKPVPVRVGQPLRFK